MPKIDIASVPIENRTNYPDAYKALVAGRFRKRIGNAVGLDQFGVNICTLKPGAASSLQHAHEREDELVYVLEGEVVLMEETGETVLKPGDAAGWKAGSGMHHCLVNRTEKDAVVLEIGTRSAVERATYTEADLIVVKDENGSRALHKNGTPY